MSRPLLLVVLAATTTIAGAQQAGAPALAAAYQIVAASTANGAWVLNTRTGAVRYCGINGAEGPVCVPAKEARVALP